MPKQQLPQNRNWYAVHTYPGCEDAVAKDLRQRFNSLGIEDKFFDVLVPREKKIKIKEGKRKVVEEKIYPGYILVEMIVTDDSWYVVQNTPRVTGFVGAGATPIPVALDEIEILRKKMEVKEPEFKIDVKIDDPIKITDGPFKNFEGKISEVDKERGKIKVLVNIFGRDTSVELDPLQIKKL